jgi:putative addiction module component (TIGR02574 family)
LTDFSTILSQIAKWSPENRIRLVQAILDSLLADQGPLELTSTQQAELDRRRAELDADPRNVFTWDQIKAHVRKK